MDDRRPAQAGAQNPAYRPAHPPLSASGVRLATGLAAAYLALAAGYAIRMARTFRRQRRDQAGTFGRVLGNG